jgi:hypothetical protein
MRINGNTYTAEVNSDQQLLARAVVVPELHHASLSGEAFAWNAVSADIDTTDTILAVRNDSSSKYLVIDKLYVWGDVSAKFDVHLITATYTAAGTAVTGVCLNKAKPTVADATAKADETGNTQGDIILTLSNNEVGSDQFGIDYDFQGSVILGEDQAIGVDIVGESAAFECTIIGHYISK